LSAVDGGRRRGDPAPMCVFASLPAGPMKLGIMQPYFFPYAGYFQLICACDHFILFDDVQYIRHGWINRNRILKPVGGWQYITVPVERHSRTDPIKNIVPHRTQLWRERILGQLRHYGKIAPHYSATASVVERSLQLPFDNITQLNLNCLREVFGYVGLPLSCSISSQRGFDYGAVADAGEWALRISEQMRASCYINPPGGAALFDRGKFENAGIQLRLLAPSLPEYSQNRPTFEGQLSVIDLMMFHSPEEIRDLFVAGSIVSPSV
jgi:hypothetical protein